MNKYTKTAPTAVSGDGRNAPTAVSPDGRIRFWEGDCMDVMKAAKDGEWDLAVVDPPYGFRTENTGILNFRKQSSEKGWNTSPTNKYFDELFRISINQIVWGGNYFPYLWKNGCRGFIYWHKGNPVPNFADGELAWTSFDRNAKQCDYRYYGNLEGKTSSTDKIHPTQKPIALYRWLLQNYAKPGNRILDTHGGSFSSAIAADMEGYEMDIIELDHDYFQSGWNRFTDYYTNKTEIAELGFARTALSKINPCLF